MKTHTSAQLKRLLCVRDGLLSELFEAESDRDTIRAHRLTQAIEEIVSRLDAKAWPEQGVRS